MVLLFKTLTKRGFTLIELIVVIAIFTVMTGILLANLPQFRDQTNLDLIAHQIAIDIRQAQVYGVSTKAVGTENQPNTFPWYGIHFKTAPIVNFEIFSHNPLNDPAGSQVYGEDNYPPEVTYALPGGYTIIDTYGCTDAEGTSCTVGAKKDLRIIFKRPDPQATFYVATDGEITQPTNGYSTVHIVLQSNRSKNTRDIVVYSNGQISVNNSQPSTQQ
jgi:prepilin-type N-terminal cleavage/methylation domain-containing protein